MRAQAGPKLLVEEELGRQGSQLQTRSPEKQEAPLPRKQNPNRWRDDAEPQRTFWCEPGRREGGAASPF